MLLTAANLSDTETAPLDCRWSGIGARTQVEGSCLGGHSGAYNTFVSPNNVAPRPLEGITATGDGFRATLPPSSVAAFKIR